MRRKLLLLLLLLAAGMSPFLAMTARADDVPINEENFPDERFRSYVLENCDTDGNGVLSDEEVLNVKNMEVQGRSILSLKGIEHFSALQQLDCSNNILFALDLSANTQLTTLACDNTVLVSYIINDSKAYVELAMLEAYGFDKTKTIGVEYEIIDNKEYICLGECTSDADPTTLTYEYRTGNEKFPTVTFIIRKQRAVPINEENFPDYVFRYLMNSIDADGNGMLTDSELGYSIFPLNNADMTSLKGIEHFLEMTRLECRYNNLTELDLSRNIKLNTVYCDNNQIQSLNVSGCTQLKSLSCADNELMSLDVSKSTALQELNFSNNQLIAINLSNNPDLGVLEASDNGISINDMLIDGKSYVPLSELVPYGFDKTRLADQTLITNIGGTEYLCLGDCASEMEQLSLTYIYNTGNASTPSAEFTISRITADMPISSEYFPDENFRRFISENCDADGNGMLSYAEFRNVTTIGISGQNVSSLQGIEHFYALSTLDCDNNQLTTLDVSKNTTLRNLNCSGNQLTMLNLSKNTKMFRLHCGDNLLTTLDLSKNSYLNELNLSNNRLIAIDLSNNPSLSWLEASGCGNLFNDVLIDGKSYVLLSELTPYGFDKTLLADQTLIVNIDGAEYLCLGECSSETERTSITYSYNTGNENHPTAEFTITRKLADVAINEENFPDETFRNFVRESYDNNGNGMLSSDEVQNVRHLEIAKNLTSLQGIEHFYALRELICYYNRLTALDVSNNTDLDVLYCSNNQLTTLDISNNTALTTLVVSNNQLTTLDISNNTALGALNCRNNKLIAIDLSYNPNLYGLDAADCGNSFPDMIIDGKSYVPLSELTPYGFDKTRLVDQSLIIDIDGTEYLCLGECGSETERISLTYSYYTGNENVPTIEFTISRKLADIAINEDNFPDKNFRRYVSENCDADSNGMLSDEEMQNVTNIQVSDMRITSLKGIEYFHALNWLDCSNNQLTMLDLNKNTTLGSLNCSGNRLTAIDLSNNPTLYSFEASGCGNPFPDMIIDGKSYVPLSELTPYGFDKTRLVDQSLINEIDGTEYLCLGECGSDTERTSLTYTYNTGNENYSTVEFTISRIQAGVTIDEENFPDENFRYYIMEICDTDGDGILSDEEVQNVTEMFVGGMEITSLKGIEHFYALITLECSYNQLTTLDISKNTNLQCFYYNENKLIAIDMSDNPHLLDIIAENNFNSFSDVLIDGKSYVPLSELTPYGFDKARLTDLSPVIEIDGIEYLCLGICTSDADPASLTYEYITGNRNIPTVTFTIRRRRAVTINEENFPDDVFRSMMTSIDTDGNGILTDEELAYTFLPPLYNNITSLKGIEHFLEMKFLNCNNKLLTELDLSRNSRMINVNCENNQLTSLNVSGCTQLTQLNCNNNALTSLDLSTNTSLSMLYCNSNQLIALDLSNCPNLRGMEANGNAMTFTDVLIDGRSYVPLTMLMPYGFDKTRLTDQTLIAEIDGTEYLCLGECKSGKEKTSLTYSYATGNEACPTAEFTISRVRNVEPVVVDEVNFPDETFRSYVFDSFDTDGDMTLSAEELDNVTSIYIDGAVYENTRQAIRRKTGRAAAEGFSLDGIDQFFALQSLTCKNVPMVAVDLSGNPNLTSVELTGNGRSFDDVLIDGKSYVKLDELAALGFDKTRLTDQTLITEIDGTEYFCLGECKSVYSELSSTYQYGTGNETFPTAEFSISRNAEELRSISLNSFGYATYSNSETVTISGATAYTAVADEEARVLWLTPIGDVIPAATGVLLIGEADAEATLTPGGETPETDRNDLIPSLTATEPEGNAYVLSGDRFISFTGGSLATNEAYLLLSDKFDSELTIIIGKPSLIGNIRADGSGDAPTFDLSGRHTDRNAKGVVIRNGKQILVKPSADNQH